MRRALPMILLSALLTGCASDGGVTSEEDLRTRPVVLPGGQKVKVEVLVKPEDTMRGMMFRDSLAPDRGMLFINLTPGNYKFWMYQVRIPLDIIWMNMQHKVVEISANTPPCPSKSAKLCPGYGGTEKSIFVLELAGGSVARYHIRVGDIVQF